LPPILDVLIINHILPCISNTPLNNVICISIKWTNHGLGLWIIMFFQNALKMDRVNQRCYFNAIRNIRLKGNPFKPIDLQICWWNYTQQLVS
jgi:hypothetical protein